MLLACRAVRAFIANFHAVVVPLHGFAEWADVCLLNRFVWEGDQILLVGVAATR